VWACFGESASAARGCCRAASGRAGKVAVKGTVPLSPDDPVCPPLQNVVKVIPSSLVSGTVAPASNVIHVTSPMVAQPTMIQG